MSLQKIFGSDLRLNDIISRFKFSASEILLVSDTPIYRAGVKLLHGFASELLLLNQPKADEDNLKLVRAAVTKNIKLVIAFGSGTINDLCKLTSAQTGIPYLVVASAPSMNGYLSKNASITIGGYKTSLPGVLPIAVIADLAILKKAPARMIKAGIGDSLCFYACWFDWLLSHLVLGTEFDIRPFKMLKPKIDFLLKNYAKFKLRDEQFIKLLMEILLLAGEGMTLAGGSYPASQSEHTLAHFLEMRYPDKMADIPHGLQIAVTTLTVLEMQKKILNLYTIQSQHPDAFPLTQFKKWFGSKASEHSSKEFAKKSSFDFKQINKVLAKNWSKYRKQLAKIYQSPAGFKKISKHFRISLSVSGLKISSKEYREALNYACFVRVRFGTIDLGSLIK